MSGLLKMTPSEGVDGTLQILDLTDKGNSREQPAGQMEEWQQALDPTRRRIGTHHQMENNQEEKRELHPPAIAICDRSK